MNHFQRILVLISSPLVFVAFGANAKVGDKVDCSAAYYELQRKVTCEVVVCSAEYATFLGSWEGPFATTDQATGLKREYRNQVTYSENDCLTNVERGHQGEGDTFIIGRQVDIYPPVKVDGKIALNDKIVLGLLITGRNAAGKPFLRTINDSEKRSDYKLEMKDETTVTSIWSLFQKDGYCKDSKCYDIKVFTFDGRDMAYQQGHKRNVKITLEAYAPGTTNKVYESELASGHHVLRK